MTSIRFRAADGLPDALLDEQARRLAAMDPWARLGYSASALARALRLGQPDRDVRLVEQDGQIVGVIVLRRHWWRGCYIELFAVYPEAAGQGLGRRALDWIVEHCEDGNENLWLLVSGFNHAARHFYTKCGFETIGTLDDLVTVGEAEVLMRKRLRPPSSAAVS